MQVLVDRNYFVEITDYHILMAEVSFEADGTVSLDSVSLSPVESEDQLKDFITEHLHLKKDQLAPCICSIYPKYRFLKKATVIDPSIFEDSSKLKSWVYDSKFEIDIDRSLYTLLNASTGSSLSSTAKDPTDVLLAGAPQEIWNNTQMMLQEYGIYPVHLQLGMLSIIGGVLAYLDAIHYKDPLLVIEINAERSTFYIIGHSQLVDIKEVEFGLNHILPIIQETLGFKDEQTVRELFYTEAFDFSEIAPIVLKRFVKEIESIKNELKEKKSWAIEKIFLPLIPRGMDWISSSLGKISFINELHVDYPVLLKALNVKTTVPSLVRTLDRRYFSLLSLMGQYPSLQPQS